MRAIRPCVKGGGNMDWWRVVWQTTCSLVTAVASRKNSRTSTPCGARSSRLRVGTPSTVSSAPITKAPPGKCTMGATASERGDFI